MLKKVNHENIVKLIAIEEELESASKVSPMKFEGFESCVRFCVELNAEQGTI